MARRGINWWKDIVLKHVRALSEDASPAHILVVSHGGFISHLIGALLGGRHIDHDIPNFRRTPLLNTSICQIDVLETLKGRLVRYGDVSHLVTPAAGHTIEHAPY
jgi:probable phosphoglycerate mutase